MPQPCPRTGKFCHTTVKKARAHLSGLKRKRAGYPGGEIYWCATCRYYHVGRRPEGLRQALRFPPPKAERQRKGA